MSMLCHGISRWCCVLSCSRGLPSASRPRIHIFAGENVCIQVTTPMQASLAVASTMKRLTASEDFSVGLRMSLTGMAPLALRASTIPTDWAATWRNVSSPYRSCDPTPNQISLPSKGLSNVMMMVLLAPSSGR